MSRASIALLAALCASCASDAILAVPDSAVADAGADSGPRLPDAEPAADAEPIADAEVPDAAADAGAEDAAAEDASAADAGPEDAAGPDAEPADAEPEDAAAEDAAAEDAAAEDAAAPDADPPDTGPPDTGPPPDAGPLSEHSYVFVTNYGDSTISVLELDPFHTQLTEVPGSPFAAPDQPWSIDFAPDRTSLFVATETGVLGYSVLGETGALTPLIDSPRPITRPGGSYGLSVDPLGRFVFVNEPNIDTTVQVYPIDAATKALSLASAPIAFLSGSLSHNAVDPQGRFLYVASAEDDVIYGYAIQAFSGALTPVPGSPFPTGPSALPFTNNPQQLVVGPTGLFLYAGNYSAGNIAVFAIDPVTGALSEVPGSPFTTEPLTCGLAVDPLETTLYVGAWTRIYTFAIGGLGFLSPVGPSPLVLGASYHCGLDVHEDGSVLFAATAGNGVTIPGSVNALAIHSGTGALTPIATASAAVGMEAAMVRARVIPTDAGRRWSLLRDFALSPAQANPQGAWSFRSAAIADLGAPAAFALLADFATSADRQEWSAGGAAPSVARTGLPAGTVLVHPGAPGTATELVAVRWESPFTGMARLGGRVADTDPCMGAGCDGVGWAVYQGPTLIATGAIAEGGTRRLDQLLNLAAGDTVDVVISPLGDDRNDGTELMVELFAVP